MNEITVDDRERKLAELEQEEAYRKYIKDHIATVLNSFITLFERNNNIVLPNPKNLKENMIERDQRTFLMDLSSKIRKHDESKYSDEEFEAYRRRFNPTEYEKEDEGNDPGITNIVKENFDKAWFHHYTHNPHHPNFFQYCEITSYDEYNMPKSWIIHKEPLPSKQDMDLGSIIHMICDWEAMSRHFNTKTVDWYLHDADKEKATMTDNTKELLKKILEMVYGAEVY